MFQPSAYSNPADSRVLVKEPETNTPLLFRVFMLPADVLAMFAGVLPEPPHDPDKDLSGNLGNSLAWSAKRIALSGVVWSFSSYGIYRALKR